MSQADRLQNYCACYETRAFPTAPSRSRLTTKHRAMWLTRPGAPLRGDNVPGRTGAQGNAAARKRQDSPAARPTQKVIMASTLGGPIRNAIEPHRGTHLNG